jgi:ComF family protein
VQSQRRCPDCLDLKTRWDRGTTLILYAGPGESIVRGIKFHGRRALLEDVRTLVRLRPDVLHLLHGAALVPVPLHSLRLRERGFNQSAWLAEAFAKEASADCTDILRRVRDTGTQTALSREERQRNVKDAFRLRRGTVLHPEQSYVLVDDVITTGATLNACAATLIDAGAKRVAVLTLAHA